jgi:hypothetical protein
MSLNYVIEPFFLVTITVCVYLSSVHLYSKAQISILCTSSKFNTMNELSECCPPHVYMQT